MTNEFNKQADAFLRDVWGRREQGLPPIKIDWNKPPAHEDLEFLLRKYPFLQIMNTEPDFPIPIVPHFIKVSSGWMVHDYGDAISASPGKDLYGAGNAEELDIKLEEDDSGGEGGHGTIVKQAFDTAQDMIALAQRKNWPGVEIIAGTPLMLWAAWMAAADLGLTLQGYEPSQEDKDKRTRVKRTLTTREMKVPPRPGPRLR